VAVIPQAAKPYLELLVVNFEVLHQLSPVVIWSMNSMFLPISCLETEPGDIQHLKFPKKGNKVHI
jgi:hypothetical protein